MLGHGGGGSSSSSSSDPLPPGFRFHPTDEELIVHYLQKQASSRPCPVAIIPEVDVYKADPWNLPGRAEFGESGWYFFTPRDRKYPNGDRPNRAAGSGYWKATGTDRAIYSDFKYVGVKKALVFYQGRAPRGTKTDWIMNEYRLCDSKSQPSKEIRSKRLDDWVLCKIYKKKGMAKTEDLKAEQANPPAQSLAGDYGHEDQMIQYGRSFSVPRSWEEDQMGSISHYFSDHPYNPSLDTAGGAATASHYGEGSYPLPEAYGTTYNQPFFGGHMFEYQ